MPQWVCVCVCLYKISLLEYTNEYIYMLKSLDSS